MPNVSDFVAEKAVRRFSLCEDSLFPNREVFREKGGNLSRSETLRAASDCGNDLNQ
jgi:hypothetical protein